MIVFGRFGPVSITVHSQKGEWLVRQIYVDEAGTSAEEPVAVCVGIIVDPDKQWRVLEMHLADIAREYFKDEADDVIFHAKDIWHGSGQFSRDRFSLKSRMSILEEILRAYSLYGMTVSVGLQHRECGADLPNDMMHFLSYIHCLVGADIFLDEKNEIGTIVAEDEPTKRAGIKSVHNLARGKTGKSDISKSDLPYVVERIVDTVHFAGKKECALLQYADAWAFIFRRFFAGLEHADQFVDLITEASKLRQAHEVENREYHLFSTEQPGESSDVAWRVTVAKSRL